MASKNCIFGIPQYATRLHSFFGGNGQKPSMEAANRYRALAIAYFKDVAERINPMTNARRSSFLRAEIEQQFVRPMENLEREREQLKAELAKTPLYVQPYYAPDAVRQQQSVALLNHQMATLSTIRVNITQQGNDYDTMVYIQRRLNEIQFELCQLEVTRFTVSKSMFTAIQNAISDTFLEHTNDIMDRLMGDRFEMWVPDIEGDTLSFVSRGDFRILQWEEEHVDEDGYYHEDPVQLRVLSPVEVPEEIEANDFIVSELHERARRNTIKMAEENPYLLQAYLGR